MHFWLRGEDKKFEKRRALVPADCKKLTQAGHKVFVEDWKDSIILSQAYADMGCEIVAKNSWRSAPQDAVIIGLKYLPNDLASYTRTHIYFAHAYKGQDDAFNILSKFKKGGGKIIDLEYMTDANGRRVCAFGYWAGFVGAALALMHLKAKNPEDLFDQLSRKTYFSSQGQMEQFIQQNCEFEENFKAIVIGAKGRSGQGARDLLKHYGGELSLWDLAETRKGGPFHEILEHDLFVNCVLSTRKIAPFLTPDLIKNPKNLKIISDVSCDPDSDCNVLPLYGQASDLNNPIIHLSKELGLIAIDNLPSILPKESSEDFSSQLVEHLINFDLSSNTALRNSLEAFTQACA